MISITLIGKEKVDKALNKLRMIDTVVATWMKSGEPDKIMQKSFTQNFASQGRPKWEKLSEETIDDRISRGFSRGPVLVRTGNLKDEITSLKGDFSKNGNVNTLEWGINQLRSTEKGKFAGHQKGFGKLPQRQIIGFQTKDAKTIANNLRTWILKQL